MASQEEHRSLISSRGGLQSIVTAPTVRVANKRTSSHGQALHAEAAIKGRLDRGDAQIRF